MEHICMCIPVEKWSIDLQTKNCKIYA